MTGTLPAKPRTRSKTLIRALAAATRDTGIEGFSVNL